jgi:parvulin-like peptidyl-prolyl isomerase
LWLIGGIAILVIGVAIVLFALNRKPSASDNTSEISPEEASKGAVAATVNGKSITLTEVDRIVGQQSGGQQTQLSGRELAQARLQVLSSLIDREVLFQRAEKEGLLPSEDEINQYINSQKTQAGLTEEQYQKRLKEYNQTSESLREEARKQLAIEKLQGKNNSKIGPPSDSEIADFYNANKEQFVSGRGVGLSMIVADPADNGAQDDVKGEAEAKLKINNIYQQLKSGADFAEIARTRSEDPSNAKGGDIGFATENDLKQNAFPKNLIRDFFGSMQVGDITSPVSFGSNRWYIFKLIRKQLQNENLTLDSPNVRQQISDAILDQRKQLANAALLERAKNEAKVVNHLASAINENPQNLDGLRPAQPDNSLNRTRN